MKLRSLFAIALAALLAPAAASAAPVKAAPAKAAKAAAPTTTSSASPFDSLTVGGFVGYESDDLGGVALRLDGEIPFKALSPQVNLSWVGSIGFSHLTWDKGFGANVTANILKIIPAARFTFPVNPQLSIFGDAGLGLYYVSMKTEFDAPFDYLNVSDSETSLMMRIGGGLWYAVNPTTRIGAAIEFNPYFGDFDQSTFLIQGGAMFKL